MDINSKMTLFGTNTKPLIYYGIEALELNLGDIDELKKIEGNAIKKIIGISNKSRTKPLYGALKFNLTEESVHLLQYKFILRAQNNSYLNK